MKVTLATATPGGGFPVCGAAFVEGVRRTDPGLEIEAVNTKGSSGRRVTRAWPCVFGGRCPANGQ